VTLAILRREKKSSGAVAFKNVFGVLAGCTVVSTEFGVKTVMSHMRRQHNVTAKQKYHEKTMMMATTVAKKESDTFAYHNSIY